ERDPRPVRKRIEEGRSWVESYTMRADGICSQDGLRGRQLRESIDLTTPVGRLMVQMIASFAQFERVLIVERVRAGMKRAQAKRPRFARLDRFFWMWLSQRWAAMA